MLARRLAAILAVAAFVVPHVPHLVGVPYDGHRPTPDGRGECMTLAFGLMLLALFASLFGSPSTDKKPYWTNVAAVGLGWYFSLALIPHGW